MKKPKQSAHVHLHVSHQQPRLYMQAVLAPGVLVHQFTPLLKMAAIQALVPASLYLTPLKTAEAYFTRAYRAAQLGLIILKLRGK